MMISLHKRSRTTPAVRTEIAASSAIFLACHFGVTRATISKWTATPATKRNTRR